MKSKIRRATKRSERQRSLDNAFSEINLIDSLTPEEEELKAVADAERSLIEQGKHHTDWWVWWLNGGKDDDRCFDPAISESWG